MPNINQPNALANGTPADGSEVYENIQTVVDLVNGSLDADNVSPTAALPGTVISTTSPIPTNRIADDAVDKDKLKDDATPGSPLAAVNTSNHIKDGIVTKAKVSGTLSLAQIDILVQTVAFSLGSLTSGDNFVSASVWTEVSGANYIAKVRGFVESFSAGTLFWSAQTGTVTPGTAIPTASRAILAVYLTNVVWDNAANTLTGNVNFVSIGLS